MLLKISDPDAPLREERKLLARRLTGASKRGAVAENQISWLRKQDRGSRSKSTKSDDCEGPGDVHATFGHW
jgi:hypothetical protein